jgi:hypothetical protein
VPSEQLKVHADVKLKLATGWIQSMVPKSGAVRDLH